MDAPWYKLVFSFTKTKDQKENWIQFVKNTAEKIAFKNIEYIASADHLLEFLPKGAGKGKALQHLRKLYPERKIICVGDYDNDLDMLLACDMPACPENALDKIKNICSIHLCHHSKGCIADLIYKLDSSIKK